ncbi:hypothetical protein XA68_11997 [Ophiocordyceps unilateralis]|uniref:Uncharacterized protein n=1 Tax=Ophiocordyceps unilateralis TaxID=268505 RepID=A0A2A9PNH2_OPHUN|nr:hypothetical protein XA68_11997 [Ophiocordyceps unilateralis]
MQHALEQPDFSLAVRSLETLTEQVARCQNLPATDGGLRLAQAPEDIRNGMRDIRNDMRDMRNDMRNMRSEMRDMRNEMRTVSRSMDDLNRKVDGLERKVDGLDRRMTVAERNGVARIENSSAMRPDASLAPLFSLETGGEIPGCPSTLDEAGALSSREIDRILGQLV